MDPAEDMNIQSTFHFQKLVQAVPDLRHTDLGTVHLNKVTKVDPNAINDSSDAVLVFSSCQPSWPKHYRIKQRWRRLNFMLEPGRGPISDLLNRVCDECEDIAHLDPVFAADFPENHNYGLECH